MLGGFSKRDRRRITKLVRDRDRQPIIQRTTPARRAPETFGIFSVKMTQTGGVDGVALTSTATWTYTIEDEYGDEELATNVNPTTAPTASDGGYFVRLATIPLIPATRGLAHFNGDGYLVVDWCNEMPNTGPCDA